MGAFGSYIKPMSGPQHRKPAAQRKGELLRVRLTEAQRQSAGIGQGLIRVAVGLEFIEDLKADLQRGLDSLA